MKYLTQALIIAVSLSFLPKAEAEHRKLSDLAPVKTKFWQESLTNKSSKSAGRSIASSSAKSGKRKSGVNRFPMSDPSGSMLENFKDTTPTFMTYQPSPGQARWSVVGACRNSVGFTHYSTDKGYADCMDAMTKSGTSAQDYFGPAQRQIGMGLTVYGN